MTRYQSLYLPDPELSEPLNQLCIRYLNISTLLGFSGVQLRFPLLQVSFRDGEKTYAEVIEKHRFQTRCIRIT